MGVVRRKVELCVEILKFELQFTFFDTVYRYLSQFFFV